MSENYYYFVAKDLDHSPTPDQERSALETLREHCQPVEPVEVTTSKHVRFFGGGENSKLYTCPSCQQSSDEDALYDLFNFIHAHEGDDCALLYYRPPCCEARVPLTSITFEDRCAFGKLAFEVVEPNPDWTYWKDPPASVLEEIEQALGCPVIFVFCHR